jgi:hypothetical protein
LASPIGSVKKAKVKTTWRMSGLSARAVHVCGVMQFWLASHTSVAASPPTACVTSPPRRRDTVTRRTHSGVP